MIALLIGLSLSVQAEGPLRNDAFVAVDERAAAALARGDVALEAARLAGGELDLTRLAPALEAWRSACEPGPDVRPVPLELARFVEERPYAWPDLDNSFARRTEDIADGVLRRLGALDSAARAAWVQRFGALGDERLRSAGRNVDALTAIERELPCTAGAARAALARADLELEAGRGFQAAAWLERAAAHGRCVGADDVLAAVERRMKIAAALLGDATQTEPEPWQRADALTAVEVLNLPVRGPRPVRVGRGARAMGLAQIDVGGLAIVGPDLVWLRYEGRPARSFEPGSLLRSHGLGLLPQPGFAGGPRVPSLPLGDGGTLVMIHGRANPFTGVGNALMAVRPPEGVGLPGLEWALGPFGHARAGAGPEPLEAVLGDGMWEFQEGALRVEDTLYVQARRFAFAASDAPSELAAEAQSAEAWILALDAADGALRWKRLLGQGTEVAPEQADRHGGGRPVRSPADPLARAGARLFVGTGLGFGALVEPDGGRVAWTFLCRRRRAEDPGWRVGMRAPFDREDSEPESTVAGPGRLCWPPGDSDHLYLMRAEPDWSGRGLLLAAPDPIGQGEELVGGEGDTALVLAAVGARRTVEARDLVTGARRRSLYLRAGEAFLGGASVSPARVFVPTDRGLYLFDRENELRLIAVAPYEVDPEAPSGGVHAFGPRIWVLAGGGLLGFSVE